MKTESFGLTVSMQENYTYDPSTDTFRQQNNYGNPQSPFTNRFYKSEEELLKEGKKRELRKISVIVGAAFLAVLILSNVWQNILLWAVSFLGISYTKFVEFIADPGAQQVTQVIYSMCLFTLPFIVAAKCGGYRISDLVSYTKSRKASAVPVFFFGMALSAFANIADSYIGSFFSIFGVDYSFDFGENPSGIFGFLLSLIATAVVPALVEEFACRGIILGLLRKFGDGFAIIVSSVLFGLVHGNFDQMPFAALLGIALGYSVVATGSLRMAVLIHFCNNSIAVIFDYCFPGLSTIQVNLIYTVFLLVSLLIGVVTMSRFEVKELFPVKDNEKVLTEKEKYITLLSGVTVIIFAVGCLYEAIRYLS